MTTALDKLCARYGVIWQYIDINNEEQCAPVESRIAILNSLGLSIKHSDDIDRELDRIVEENSARILPEYLVIDPDRECILDIGEVDSNSKFKLNLENGDCQYADYENSKLHMGKLPVGIHILTFNNQNCLIICAPTSLPLPKQNWGVMVPLYGLRDERNLGIGDFHDLAASIKQFSQFGASFIGINPVHASFPDDPTAFSPYSPSNRRFLNTIHIAIENLDGWIEGDCVSRAAADVPDLINYDQVIAEKTKKFWNIFRRSDFDNEQFGKYKSDAGDALIKFATHQALSEKFDPYWCNWPKSYQRPDSEEVAEFQNANGEAIEFHCWLQWQAHKQFSSCKIIAEENQLTHGIYVDLAVGVHPHGSETWANENEFARGVSLGAPADSFAADGQNWGLSPLNPVSLRQNNFKSFIETVRSQLRYAGMLRIDHIIGFERSFWIPDGLPGAYVKMPTEQLFAILRLEAHRCGAVIIGEDLGNIPDGFRETLEGSGILGCRVAIFERNWKTDRKFISPANYTKRALASLSTHDLPPFAGWWKGTDINWRHELKHISKAERDAQQGERRQDCAEFSKNLDIDHQDATGVAETVNWSSVEPPTLSAHKFLSNTSSCLTAVQIEDMLELDQSANLPGTVFDHPNWRRRLPLNLNKLPNNSLLNEISSIMGKANRGATTIKDSKAS